MVAAHEGLVGGSVGLADGLEFDASDLHGLLMLAVLVDDFWLAESPTTRSKLAGEIRQQSQRFGLSPLDRRRLQWEIEHISDAPEPRRVRARGGVRHDCSLSALAAAQSCCLAVGQVDPPGSAAADRRPVRTATARPVMTTRSPRTRTPTYPGRAEA